MAPMPPVIILVHPQMGENIGAAARVMANFGLSELRLVAPRDGWPNFQAQAVAAHATHIVDAAKIYGTTEEAIADLELVYATCCRMRDMEKPVITPRELIPTLDPNQRVGILFGPERTGVENADMVRAAAHIFIPVNPEYQSLNLAQAVGVVAYEWFANKAPAPQILETGEIATQEEVEGMLKHLEGLMDEANFYQVPHKKPKMDQNIRNIFTRARLKTQEVSTLRGIFRALGSKKD